VPPVRPIVTEYRRHRLTCPRCSLTTCGSAPSGQDGPRLKAAPVVLVALASRFSGNGGSEQCGSRDW
jgi:transposase